jgi:hypothetical protein
VSHAPSADAGFATAPAKSTVAKFGMRLMVLRSAPLSPQLATGRADRY